MTIRRCFFFLLLLPCLAQAQTFTVDKGHTAVMTSVQRFGMVEVVGRFTDVSGTIVYAEDLAGMSCDLAIKAESYQSNNPEGELAVKTVFLNTGMYPDITFRSTGVSRNSKGKLIASGMLTIRGTSKPVSFPIAVLPPFMDPTGTMTIAVSAELTINRQDYGMDFNKMMPDGQPFVADEVVISVDLLAAQQ